MRFRHPSAVVLTALLLLGAAAVRAQTPTRDRPFPTIDDPRRWGPFDVDLGFTLENFGYDDNIYLAPASSGEPTVGDWIVRVAPDVNAQVKLGRRIAVTLRDKVTGEFFLDNDNLNHWDNEVQGQFDLLLGPVLLTTRGEYSDTEQRPNSELRNRVQLDERLVGQGLRLFLSPRTDAFAEVTASEFSYQDPGVGYVIIDDPTLPPEVVPIEVALDRSQTRVVGELGWRAHRGLRFFARGENIDYDFDERDRDSEERRLLGGIEFNPGARLSGRLAAGLTRLEETGTDRSLEPAEEPVGEALLVYRPTGSTRLTLRWDRQLFFSTVENNLYFVGVNRSLSLDTYLGNWWGLQAGYTDGESEYPEPLVLPPNEGVVRRDDLTDYYGGILFRTRGDVEIGFRIGRRERVSTAEGVEDIQKYFTTTGRYAF